MNQSLAFPQFFIVANMVLFLSNLCFATVKKIAFVANSFASIRIAMFSATSIPGKIIICINRIYFHISCNFYLSFQSLGDSIYPLLASSAWLVLGILLWS